MLTYEPGDTLAHRLDPRSKLAFQVGFAIAAFASPSLRWLGVLGLIALAVLAVGRLSPLRALRAYWFVLLVLSLGPVLAGLEPGPPWFVLDRAADSLRSVVRLVPILLVSAAFVHTTPVRETRAMIQRHVPSRFGQLLGVAVGMTVRFVPVVRADLRGIRAAIAARGGDARPVRDRAVRIPTLAVSRALARADRLSTALSARCFAYNPTLPTLRFRPVDHLVLGLSVLLALTPLLPSPL